MHNYEGIVKKYSRLMTVLEESDGFYDYDDGGKYKTAVTEKEVEAAMFNLSGKDISSSFSYGEGGGYTTSDIKIYTFVQLPLGVKISDKGKTYTVTKEIDYSEHANGLRVYFAKGTTNN